jgi:hypothetical protein
VISSLEGGNKTSLLEFFKEEEDLHLSSGPLFTFYFIFGLIKTVLF